MFYLVTIGKRRENKEKDIGSNVLAEKEDLTNVCNAKQNLVVTVLTRISLNAPLRRGKSLSPKRSFICDVNTCNAAAVVNPLTRLSARRDEITPKRSTYIPN